MACVKIMRRPGSSPLARGTRFKRQKHPQAARIIPARTGNTCHVRAPRAHAWAHPRSRGEHKNRGFATKPPTGSSPLARGTHHDRAHQLCRPGLIPARAGNTCTCMIRGPLMGAHPRSRGEHELAAAQVENAKGSSPLARGTLVAVAAAGGAGGLIPARAGNTS